MQSHEKHNTKTKFYISPTARLDLLSALTKAQAKEQAKGKKHKKLLEQVDLFVVVALFGHRNNKTGQCDPSHATIASEIGVSESTVKRSFKRLADAGFITTTAKFFKGRKSSSQVDIQFQKGESWIIKSDEDWSSVTDRSVTDDATIGHQCPPRSVADDTDARSLMTDKHSEQNPEKEPSEENTRNAPRQQGPVGRDGDVDGDEARPTPPGGNWPADMVEKFQSHYPKGGDRTKISEALEAIRLEGLTDYRDILRGAKYYTRDERKKIEDGFALKPENFLTKRLYTGYQKDNRPKPRMHMAI
ncbi:DNA-binding transcriptional regulator YhcF (GntR family) [Bradyrhizobium sp. LB8.2]|uniref:helix-turn-helix domain-containing protein n=1 Tax=Bradyrhizobium sp. LB8.2 TaxID=3156330 RepID=UPI00339AB23A